MKGRPMNRPTPHFAEWCGWCPRLDSNQRPPGSEPGALSAELRRLGAVVRLTGLEPATSRFVNGRSIPMSYRRVVPRRGALARAARSAVSGIRTHRLAGLRGQPGYRTPPAMFARHRCAPARRPGRARLPPTGTLGVPAPVRARSSGTSESNGVSYAPKAHGLPSPSFRSRGFYAPGTGAESPRE